ncbi:MAG: cobalamin biosynthesis protein CobN, partial [Candidatus Hermodarchaeota archaeon]|nr:cobalamin biosynthesis protein CobN [Candidatus Hermodarchaeota archaeon]
FLGREGIRVLAVDADPTPTLASALGIPSEVAAKIVPLTENDELVEERTGMDKKTYGGMFKLNPRVSDLSDKFGVPGPDNVTLLVAGTVTIGGSGCMCPAGALLKALIRHLIVGTDEAFVMDLEAGIENLGRGTSRGMDALIAVVEPGQSSINTVERIQKLAHDIGVDTIFAVGNKIMDDVDQTTIESTLDVLQIPLLTSIPFDKGIRQANLKGIAPLDYAPESPGLQAIKSIIPKLRAHLPS